MFRWVFRIRPIAWGLLFAIFLTGILPYLFQLSGIVTATVAYSVIQPIMAILTALFTYWVTKGQKDRMRHETDTSLIVGSVMAVWFVAYFASGMIVTYVHNAVATNWQIIVTNVLVFGLTAVAMEYARRGIMMVGGRRNVVWFGLMVSLVAALQQVSFAHMADITSGLDVVKVIVADVMPAIAASTLLTYLTIRAGIGPQLVYRLGIIAVMYLPSIIPKYDWYLSGVSWLVLSIAVYAVVNRMKDDDEARRPRKRHVRRAADIMFMIVTTMLVLFMIGAFPYKPQVIMSDSMQPIFSRGSMVIVQSVSAMDVKVGDIVQYKTSERTITHRVIAIKTASDGSGEQVFVTKGDNNPSKDSPAVRSDQIIGIVRSQIPFIGYPTVWLKEAIM